MIIEQCLIFGRPCHKTDIGQREQCFIIMDYKGAHSSSIKDVLRISVQKAFSLKPVLASEVKLPWSKDMFCDKICEPIRRSKLSIADITYDNTNVGFEIGISQMMGVPVIITFHKEWREETIGGKIDFSIIPADFAGRYVVPYSNHEDLTQKLKIFNIEKKVEEIRVSRSKKHPAYGGISPADKKEVDLLLNLLQNPNEDVQKSAAIDLEDLSRRKSFTDPHHVEEVIKIIKGLKVNNSNQNALDAGLHTAKLPQEPPKPSGLMLLLMETLYNMSIYAVQSKNDAIINKIREYSEVLANIAFDTSHYAKWYDRYLPQIRAVMILYYINSNKAIDALLKLLEIDEFVEIPSRIRGVRYNSELVDACLLLSDKHGIEIKGKLYELVGNPNKNISRKAQLILKDL